MCHLASRSSLSSNCFHSNCCYSVNTTLATLHAIICKHLAHEVIHCFITNCLFGSGLVCRCFILYVALLLCVRERERQTDIERECKSITDYNLFYNDVMKHFLCLLLFGSTEYEPDYFPGNGRSASFKYSSVFPSHLFYQCNSSFSCSETPDSQNPDSLPGTYQQQVRLEPVVRPEKSGISSAV